MLIFTWKSKETRLAKTVLEKKNKVEGIDFKTYYKTTVIKAKEIDNKSMEQTRESRNRLTEIWPSDF